MLYHKEFWRCGFKERSTLFAVGRKKRWSSQYLEVLSLGALNCLIVNDGYRFFLNLPLCFCLFNHKSAFAIDLYLFLNTHNITFFIIEASVAPIRFVNRKFSLCCCKKYVCSINASQLSNDTFWSIFPHTLPDILSSWCIMFS